MQYTHNSTLLFFSPVFLIFSEQKCSLGRRAFVRLLKFGVHQGCLKVIHVPFGTACALINRNEGESGEISAEMLRREAAELSGLDPTQPSTMPEPTGRRFVREAAVVYLQRPFDVKQYMMEVHVNRGSRPDSLGNLVENPNDGSAALDDSVQIIRDDDGLAPPADDVLACSPFCKFDLMDGFQETETIDLSWDGLSRHSVGCSRCGAQSRRHGLNAPFGNRVLSQSRHSLLTL